MSKQISMFGAWEQVEIVLEAQGSYSNPYTDVEVWVDLTGPGFQQTCYGFWDGGNIFRVRVTGPSVGLWKWTSHANVADAGLNGQSGRFEVRSWTQAELQANPNRRGFIRSSANGHALEYADGTPFFLMGDTWWAAPSYRYPWYEDDQPRPVGPEWGFKDMVRFRKTQGFNSVAILACHPAWANDGKPDRINFNDAEKTCVREAWRHPGTGSSKDMHNEGGRPFEFPGNVPGYEDVYPDINRINPAYFQAMDRKMTYLTDEGFVPFLEVLRRDASMCWKNFYDWPGSYIRYIQYAFRRYQASNVILSPIHFDWIANSIHPQDYNTAINAMIAQYGLPPFGNLLSCNASPSSLAHFGDAEEAPWLGLHQIGNWREHVNYWYLTEIHQTTPPRPALNGEPYYSGLKIKGQLGTEGGSEIDDRWVRSGMYGSFLSGGLAGHIYGAEGIWGADVEEESPLKMWDAFQWNSANEVKTFLEFVFCEGDRYRELVPDANRVIPNGTQETWSYEGWAYCAATADRRLVLAYFEKGCRKAVLRALSRDASYKADWFDVRTGKWIAAGVLKANCVERIELPEFPSPEDWALRLVRIDPA